MTLLTVVTLLLILAVVLLAVGLIWTLRVYREREGRDD
jgi:hypothetical protein